MPSQLIGIVQVNNAGFGEVTKAVKAFFQLEIEPLMSRFLEVNDWIGEEAVRLKPFQPVGATAEAA